MSRLENGELQKQLIGRRVDKKTDCPHYWQMFAAGGRAGAGVWPALWPDWSERPGEDYSPEDAGQSQPARASPHLHPARGARGGG